MYEFGSGSLFITPQGANAPTHPTPIQIGVLQETQIDIDRTLKELYGKLALPVAVAGGKMKVMCKSKFARFSGKTINDMFFGSALTLGSTTLAAVDETQTGAASVAVTHQSSWVQDLGVRYASNGNLLEFVASGPVAGQYTVSAGTYVFAGTDIGKQFLISYTYTVTSGTNSTFVNPQMGNQPVFNAVFNENFAQTADQITYKFRQCVSSKLSLPYKNEDFTVADFEFQAFADAAGNVMDIFTTET